ncbi:MAG TPA: glycosyltransferase family 2 protein [Candidatus Paceibacterota bacterium]|nr:glycosyltransferase family 2 protein [Candidatus Paceibacterota bacterium]
MESVYTVIFYIFSFLSVYVQIFLLMTYLEKRRHIVHNPEYLELSSYPTVTVAIPCYNEEATIDKTVKSLLALDYPKDKIKIFLIDDGSKDNTWNIIKSFENGSNIFAFHKENGGKHTALNLALEHTTSEFFGCLDSDSFVHPESLKRILKYFENDPTTMAVAPSIIVYNPKNIIQYSQNIEYDMSIYTKKMLGFMGGIHVTPGPFSIFRKKVFDDLGYYRKAHNTEDQEIALRMQEHGYKIDHCPDAYVYTNTPDSVVKLYRQRLRWIYGFIKNMVDYRRLLFKKEYGTVALFTLPSGLISIFGVIFLFVNITGNIIKFIYQKIIEINTVGLGNISAFNLKFDWFFINTKAALLFVVILYILVIVSMMIGRKLSDKKSGFSFSIFYFIIIYSVIAPFWMLKAIYNAIFSKESSWTFERRVTTK